MMTIIDIFEAALIPGGLEIVVILFIVLILYGGKKLPELARGLGEGIKEFKKASNDVKEDIKKEIDLSSSDNGDSDSPSNEKLDSH